MAMLDPAWMAGVKKEVSRRMKTFDIGGSRQSRRIQGMLIGDEEVTGFENVCIYIHTALAGKEEVISEILSGIDKLIYGQDHYPHGRYLMFFNGTADPLLAPRPSFMETGIPARNWRGTILKYLNPSSPTESAIIPSLRNSDHHKTRAPGSGDLALFFCRGKGVFAAEPVLSSVKSIRDRSLWFFFAEGQDLPEFSTGKHYMPSIPCSV